MAHFYLNDGTQIAYVPYANAQRKDGSMRDGMRPATLADARKHYPDWKPSTTGILGERDKPQLNDWRVGEGIKVALGMGVTEVTDEVLAAVKRQSEEYRDWAASFGTAVHDGIATAFKLNGWVMSPLLGVDEIVEGFIKWAEANALVVNESELSFSSSLGWGGTIDGLGTYWGEPGLFDWKTQDYGAIGDKNQKAVFYDPEWPLQMASYDIGWREAGEHPESFQPLPRISFVISRTVPGLVTAKQWPDPERYDAGWLSLWEHWQAVHKWGEWAPKNRLELLQGELFDAGI